MNFKKYNPFKIWGSYVGAVIGFFVIIAIPFGAGALGQNTLGKIFPSLWNTVWSFIFGILLIVIIGFLIGRGIHSLIRRFWK